MGVEGTVAADTIKRENPYITTVSIVLEGSSVTTDYVTTRVRKWHCNQGPYHWIDSLGCFIGVN